MHPSTESEEKLQVLNGFGSGTWCVQLCMRVRSTNYDILGRKVSIMPTNIAVNNLDTARSWKMVEVSPRYKTNFPTREMLFFVFKFYCYEHVRTIW